MNKFSLAAIALAASITSPALAADLARRAPPPVYRAPPPVAPVWTWTGCYIGGHVGGLWAQKDWSDATPGALTFGTAIGSHDADGWLGGVQAGCDYQFVGGFVIGIQADYAWTDADGTSESLLNPAFSIRSNIESLGSATARIGFAWDRFLGYLKGGAAWERNDYDVFSNVTQTIVAESGERRRFGWTVGVGAEYAFTNFVSGFVEYNYYDFDTDDFTFNDGRIVDIKETKNVVKAGLNFRFLPWLWR